MNHVQIVPEGETVTQQATLDAKLKKLGHHVRLGWEQQPIDTEKNLATVRGAVREQWQKEREEKLAKPPAPNLDKTKEQEPPEPERD